MATPKEELNHPNPVISLNHPSGSVISITNVNKKDKTSGKGGNIQIASVADLKLISRGEATLYTDTDIRFIAKGMVSIAEVIITHGKLKAVIENGNKNKESVILLKTPLMQITNGLGNITIDKTSKKLFATWGTNGILITEAFTKIYFNNSTYVQCTATDVNIKGHVKIIGSLTVNGHPCCT